MSIIVAWLENRSGGELAVLSFLAYLFLYTMYDKQKKALVPGKVISVLMLSDGLSKTLIELNKIVALSGLSLLCIAFIPLFSREKFILLWFAMTHLWLHAVYSLYQYFDILTGTKRWKQLSLIFGTLDQVLISAGYLGYISTKSFSLGGIVLGVAHFYFMEIDDKFVLRVRPFAYIVFPLAFAGVIFNF